jgi:hypothetical protein
METDFWDGDTLLGYCATVKAKTCPSRGQETAIDKSVREHGSISGKRNGRGLINPRPHDKLLKTGR